MLSILHPPRLHTIARLFALLLGLAMGDAARAAPVPALPAPPSTAAQTAAEKLIKDVYKAEFTKTATSDKEALATKLLEEGKSTNSDMASKFVLLRDARDLASEAGDVDTAMAAVDALAESFAVDVVDLKLTALNRAGKTASAPIGSAIVAAANAVIDAIVATDQFTSIGKVAALSELPAVRASAAQALSLRSRIAEARTIATQFDKAKAALDKLKSDPADPEANLAAGRYLCFLKGDWTTGLPLLAKSSDASLKAQAQADQNIPADLQGFKKLADAWWTLSEKEDAASRHQIQIHAAEWYAKAVDGLDGLAKTIAEKRIADAHKAPGVAGRVINLIPLIDTARDKVWGDWHTEKGALVCDNGGLCPRVLIPYNPPEEYDVHIEWTQPKLRNPIFIVLSKNDSNCALCIGTQKGRITNFDGIPGRRDDDKATGFQNRPRFRHDRQTLGHRPRTPRQHHRRCRRPAGGHGQDGFQEPLPGRLSGHAR